MNMYSCSSEYQFVVDLDDRDPLEFVMETYTQKMDCLAELMRMIEKVF